MRVAALRREPSAGHAVHHAAVIGPVNVRASPRFNIRSIGEDVRQAVVYAVARILVQTAEAVQHTRGLLSGERILRCKPAAAHAVHHAQRGAEKHIFLIRIRERNGFRVGFLHFSGLVPSAVHRRRQRTEIRTSDGLRVVAVHLFGHNARRPRGLHRRLCPAARTFRRKRRRQTSHGQQARQHRRCQLLFHRFPSCRMLSVYCKLIPLLYWF